METVMHPSPGLYAAVLHAFNSAAPRSRSLASTVADLTYGLTVDQAECLPVAVGGVLPLLGGDAERMRFAAKIAARFDLFEAADSVARIADATGDRYLLLIAATLCGNPAVDSSLRARIADSVGTDPAIRIRLDHHHMPTTAEEQLLYQQCWPGARTDDVPSALPPVVVLDRGFDARSVLQLATSLDQAGAVVRRLVPDSDIPLWFGPHTVLVCQYPTRVRVRSTYPTFPEERIICMSDLPEHDRQLNKLLREVNACLPRPQRLRLDELRPEVATSFWKPDVFMAGVYETKETAFLAGATRSSLDYLRRMELLTPLKSRAIRWTFRDLVAVRTWTYLKGVAAPKKVSSRVVPELARFAGDAQAVKLGVTSAGRVLVDQGRGWVDVYSGQTTFDNLSITDVDDVFQPFPYGKGTTVRLPDVGHNTTLHPEVLHGTPHLKDHRISAKSLASLDARNGHEAILSTYPELTDVPFDGAVTIGRQLLWTF